MTSTTDLVVLRGKWKPLLYQDYPEWAKRLYTQATTVSISPPLMGGFWKTKARSVCTCTYTFHDTFGKEVARVGEVKKTFFTSLFRITHNDKETFEETVRRLNQKERASIAFLVAEFVNSDIRVTHFSVFPLRIADYFQE
jgi:hypothetical protein